MESVDGLTLLDCGVDWQEGLDALIDGFQVLGLDPQAVNQLIVTHLHPDHVGMAPRLSELWDCKIVMHQSSADRIPRYNDTPAFADRTRLLAMRHGVPSDLQREFGAVDSRAPFMPLMRQPDVLVSDGDQIDIGDERSLTVLHTPGHEASHICLRDSRTGIVFSGDHVLPRITPVIMYDDDTGVDVLGQYIDSLNRLVDLRIGLTYPAHGGIVEHGSRRAEQIVLHHDRRLDGMLDVVTGTPRTGWEVMVESYRPHLNSLEQRLALRETISHLEHLRTKDLVTHFEEGRSWFYRSVT